jgi:hypothetical protein
MHILTREALYELVWAEPMNALGERLDIAPAKIKASCDEAGVPTPGVAYWARIRAGKFVSRPALPARPLAAAAIMTLGYYGSYWRSPREMIHDPVPIAPDFSETIEAMVERASVEVAVLPDDGRFAPRRKIVLLAEGRRRKPGEPPPIHPRTGAPWERRRIHLLERLYSLFTNAGIEPGLKETEDGVFSVNIGAAWVKLTLSWAGDTNHPDGLRLTIQPRVRSQDFPQVFADEEEAPLESQLRAILLALMIAAEVQYRADATRHYQWCLERRAEAEEDIRKRNAKAKRLRRERRVQREQRRRDELYAQADAWRTARDIRGFVDEVLAEARRPVAELRTWARWARDEADALDPVKSQGLVVPET